MPTSYTSVLKLALPVTGELSGTWGDVVNQNITAMVEQAITGIATINTWTGASHTLTVANGVTSESRCAILECSGTPGAAAEVICPTAPKIYIVKNLVVGGYAVTLKTAAGTGIIIPNGKTVWVYCDGTNVVQADDYLSSLTLGTPLTVSNGGTGVATVTASYIPYGAGTSPLATSSNLQFDGTVMRVGSNAVLGGLTNPVIASTGSTNNYIQSYIYNATNGASSSSDFVAYANNSTDAHGWADLGFTSASYADATYTVTGPNEAYVFGSALNSTYTGNLVYATDSTGSTNSHQWYVGGFTQAKSAWKMQLTSTGLQLANALTAAYGGTGLTTPGAVGNVLTSNGTAWTSAAAGASLTGITQSATPFITALGYQAGTSATGIFGTFAGYQAGTAVTTAQRNTAFGALALKAATTAGNNTAIGYNTLAANTTSNNTAVGSSAGAAITTGGSNTAIGSSALATNTTGASFVAIGSNALQVATGGNSTAVGANAGLAETTGSYNTYLGNSAGGNITTGIYNVLLGPAAASGITTGSYNTAIGNATLGALVGGNSSNSVAIGDLALNATSGTDNTAVGYRAGRSISSGIQNTIFGNNAGYSGTNNLTTGSNNIILGYNAAASSATVSNEVTLGNASVTRLRVPGLGIDWTSAPANLTGETSYTVTRLGISSGASNSGANNTFIGLTAGFGNTTGATNTALGDNALYGNTTSNSNVAVGAKSVQYNNGSGFNVAVGVETLNGLSGLGGSNVAVGHQALKNHQVNNTVAIGYAALKENTAGGQNTAVGHLALTFNTTGTANTAIGYQALDATTTATDNTAIGNNALGTTTVGSYNTAVGSLAGLSLTTGTRNVLLGNEAGRYLTTGQYNTVLGNNAATTTQLSTGSNNILIGYDAASSTVSSSNEITLGNTSIATLRCQVTTITSLSDARDKTAIAPIRAGLNFVNQLKPVSFMWNMRDGGKVGEQDTGFIAQDLKTAQELTGVTIPGLVYEVNPERLEAGYSKLLPVLVKAIQDLSAEIEVLKTQLGNK